MAGDHVSWRTYTILDSTFPQSTFVCACTRMCEWSECVYVCACEFVVIDRVCVLYTHDSCICIHVHTCSQPHQKHARTHTHTHRHTHHAMGSSSSGVCLANAFRRSTSVFCMFPSKSKNFSSKSPEREEKQGGGGGGRKSQ